MGLSLGRGAGLFPHWTRGCGKDSAWRRRPCLSFLSACLFLLVGCSLGKGGSKRKMIGKLFVRFPSFFVKPPLFTKWGGRSVGVFFGACRSCRPGGVGVSWVSKVARFPFLKEYNRYGVGGCRGPSPHATPRHPRKHRAKGGYYFHPPCAENPLK